MLKKKLEEIEKFYCKSLDKDSETESESINVCDSVVDNYDCDQCDQ